MRPLAVWMYDRRIAEISSRDGRQIRVRYTEEARKHWDPNTPLLSCSLPLTSGRGQGEAFFSGLLPEGAARDKMAAQIGVRSDQTFALLRSFGRDVAGALEVRSDPPEDRPSPSPEPYSQESLADAVNDLEERPLDLHDDSELSLAGMENKLLLVRAADGRWARPRHGQPSTHILKRDHPRHIGLVAAEAAALRIARSCGLTSISPQLETHGDYLCIIVDRYDRDDSGSVVRRLHQEDACQATGTVTLGNARQKYQKYGGPSYRDVARLLTDYADDAEAELNQLVRVLVFTVLIGNSDAHGKNLSLLHRTPGKVTLAPLYDTVPTALWPTLKEEAAMYIDECSRLPSVRRETIQREVRRWPGRKSHRESLIDVTIEQVADAATRCDHPDLAGYVQRRAGQLRA